MMVTDMLGSYGVFGALFLYLFHRQYKDSNARKEDYRRREDRLCRLLKDYNKGLHELAKQINRIRGFLKDDE